jgi:hypothetical protein
MSFGRQDWGKVVGAFYTPTGQKGGFWGRGDGGCLRYLLMFIILFALMFTLLFILDNK